MKDHVLVMLAGQGQSTTLLYNALKNDFQIEKVIIEDPVPRAEFLKRRAKKLGWPRVAGQVMFQAVAVPYLEKTSQRRVQSIKRDAGLDDTPIDDAKVVRVASANAPQTIELLSRLKPDIVVINGTRIISKDVLNCTSARFVNMHAGITPLYRGVHGGYWALFACDPAHCGVTVHFVDSGIDTGSILEQATIRPAPDDNFATYPLLQLVAGIPLLKKALEDIVEGRAQRKPNPAGRSKLWSHPTLNQYFWNRLCRGVK